MALKTYSITDFPGANFNADLTSAGFRAPSRVLNVDFASGTGIDARPAFRTHTTAGGSQWFTWCQALRPLGVTTTGELNISGPVAFDTAASYSPIILRTPQSGSTNLFAVSQFDGSTHRSMTLGGVAAGTSDNIFTMGGLSITSSPINSSNYVIACATSELAYYAPGVGGSMGGVASPGYGSYATGTYSYVAILGQSQRLLVAQTNGRVWFSDALSTTFTSPNYFTISAVGQVTNMFSVEGNVYVLSTGGIYLIYGETTDANGNALVQWRKISDLRCPVPYYGSCLGDDGTIYILSTDGLYALRGTSVSRIQLPFDYTRNSSAYAPYGTHSNRDTLTVNTSGKDLHYFPYFGYFMNEYHGTGPVYDNSNSSIGIHQGGGKLFIYAKSPDLGTATATTLTTTKGGTWVLDIASQKWAYWDISPLCMTTGHEQIASTSNFYESRGSGRRRFYFTSSGAGYTNWTAKTLNRSDPWQSADTPANINVEYFTGFDNFGAPSVEKRFESVRVYGAATSSVTIDFFPDFQSTASYLGSRATFNVGDYSLAGPTRAAFKIFPINLSADKLAFKIYRNSSQHLWHIGQLDVMYDDGIKANTLVGGLPYSSY